MPHKAMWIYAWDLQEEGTEKVVRELAGDVGINARALANAYHSVEHLRPRAKGAKVFRSEQAALYYEPDLSFYSQTKLRHRVSPIVKEKPVLPDFVEACEKHRVRPESWTVVCHNSFLGSGNPDCVETNVYGDFLVHALCPANPDVRAYAVALCRDLESQGIEIIELESLSFHGFGHAHHHTKFGVDFGGAAVLIGLCFCSHCRSRAASRGVDVAELVQAIERELDSVLAAGHSDKILTDYLEDLPGLRDYLRVRQETGTSLLQEIKDAVRIQVNFLLMGDEYRAGFDFAALAEIADQVEVLAYTPSAGRVTEIIQTTCEKTGTDELVIGYSVYKPMTPDEQTLEQNVQAALDVGVSSFSFYNYGIMPPENLKWVTRAAAAIDAAAG